MSSPTPQATPKSPTSCAPATSSACRSSRADAAPTPPAPPCRSRAGWCYRSNAWTKSSRRSRQPRAARRIGRAQPDGAGRGRETRLLLAAGPHERGLLHRRRQHRAECRRPARGEIRRHARKHPRAGRRHRHRRDPSHRLLHHQGRRRLRPHAPADRLGGHARRRHRGHAQAHAAARIPAHVAGGVS